jgi:hypothetical protein
MNRELEVAAGRFVSSVLADGPFPLTPSPLPWGEGATAAFVEEKCKEIRRRFIDHCPLTLWKRFKFFRVGGRKLRFWNGLSSRKTFKFGFLGGRDGNVRGGGEAPGNDRLPSETVSSGCKRCRLSSGSGGLSRGWSCRECNRGEGRKERSAVWKGTGNPGN